MLMGISLPICTTTLPIHYYSTNRLWRTSMASANRLSLSLSSMHQTRQSSKTSNASHPRMLSHNIYYCNGSRIRPNADMATTPKKNPLLCSATKITIDTSSNKALDQQCSPHPYNGIALYISLGKHSQTIPSPHPNNRIH